MCREFQEYQTYNHLSDYCFTNCENLREIKGLEHVKEIGKGCFFNCPKLYNFENPIFLNYKPKTEYKM
ncbi:MAG: leucine-rich repeat protein, partial [Clostridia bacterium]|nr:leucine-rich repeat protein [Clostridia bacterium]